MNLLHIFVVFSSVLSVVLGIFCCVPYYRAIFAGKTKPHQMTWIVFGIMNGISTFSQLLAGARASVLLPATFFVANVYTVILSFKYGVRDTSRYDKLLLAFSLITIVVWILTRSNEAAIWLTVLIDIFATTMTILKIKNMPDSEDAAAWVIALTAYTFTCFSLAQTRFGILYVRPIYGFLSDLAIVTAVYYFGRGRAHRKSRNLQDSPSEN